MNIVRIIAYILVIIGAINWGLIGILDFDLVAFLFGEMTIFTRIIYGLVGISGLIVLFTSYRDTFNNDNY